MTRLQRTNKRKPNTQQPRINELSLPTLHESFLSKTKDFQEIGGSPAPGFTLIQLLRGHKHTIHSIVWSPDGKTLASGSTDTTIRLWDPNDGEEIRMLRGHMDVVRCVAWSPDGKTLASGSHDQTIRLWDPIDGEEICILTGHTDQIHSVAWSPDGKTLASGSTDTTIRLWDAANGKEIGVLNGHMKAVHCVAWSPDGKTLASGSVDLTIRLWDTENIKELSVLEGHTDMVFMVQFSSDGRLLASRSIDQAVRIWSANVSTPPVYFNEREPMINPTVGGLAFHPDKPVLATLGEDALIIRIWDLDIDTLLGSQAAAESVRYTTAKIVLVGDSGVGKTGLGWRMAHSEYKEHASTHGQQFWVIDELGTKRKDGTECEAVLWDLAGQHIYRSVHAIFLDDVDYALVLFDPTNRQEPLKGAQFWLEQLAGKKQLPPAALIGARLDRGAAVLSQQELDQFCQRYGIRGGYIGTSASSGEGLEKLLETLKTQLPWEQMTATVTTVTFKRIKEYVLALKEKPDRQGVLVNPQELRRQLEASVPDWQFTDAEMMTAVKHLENHGYVFILQSASGEQAILLTPDLLVDLASSIVLQADKHPRELGAMSETALLQGGYPFPELVDLPQAEGQILVDAAVARFLSHNICFRETLGAETLLIFPGLIKQKRPLLDEVETLEDVSYIVRGRVENIYAALVVLLGYTQTFTRVNQWQNQAQYEMGAGEICGFRLIEERDGEIELVLYYSAAMPNYGRTMFQGLFEKFLYQRDADVTRFSPVVCPKSHRQERATVVKRLLEGKKFLFCAECGEKIILPEIEKPMALGAQDTRWVQQEESLARLRSTYETHLVRIKGYRRDRTAPRCFISYAPEKATWVLQLAEDLSQAGVYILKDMEEVQENDFVILIGTPAYKQAWDHSDSSIAADRALIRPRLQQTARPWPTLVPLLRSGEAETASLSELRDRLAGDFRDDTHYAVSLFDLVLTLYAIPLNHPAFVQLRHNLQRQWDEMTEGVMAAEAISTWASTAGSMPAAPDGEKEIFISYAWGDESEEMANALDKAFQDRGVTIVRDKRDVGFKGSIKEFMRRIGRGKCVILIISEKYLKSENCLFELLHVAQHGDFADRIFPVVMGDAHIYKPVERIGYVQYWEKQVSNLDEAMKTVSAANMQGFRDDIDLYTEIRAQLPRLADILKDMNALTPQIHRETDFNALFEAVMARLSS